MGNSKKNLKMKKPVGLSSPTTTLSIDKVDKDKSSIDFDFFSIFLESEDTEGNVEQFEFDKNEISNNIDFTQDFNIYFKPYLADFYRLDTEDKIYLYKKREDDGIKGVSLDKNMTNKWFLNMLKDQYIRKKQKKVLQDFF